MLTVKEDMLRTLVFGPLLFVQDVLSTFVADIPSIPKDEPGSLFTKLQHHHHTATILDNGNVYYCGNCGAVATPEHNSLARCRRCPVSWKFYAIVCGPSEEEQLARLECARPLLKHLKFIGFSYGLSAAIDGAYRKYYSDTRWMKAS